MRPGLILSGEPNHEDGPGQTGGRVKDRIPRFLYRYRKNAGITLMLIPYDEKHVYRLRINFRIMFLSIATVLLFTLFLTRNEFSSSSIPSELLAIFAYYSSHDFKYAAMERNSPILC